MRHIIIALTLFLGSVANAEEIEEILVIAPAYGNYQIQHYVPEEFTDSFHVQETSPGQLSPYIGPFTGNTVNQLVNGIRVNNAYFRSGPNQYFGWIPFQFVDTVGVTDGGNIGGTINRVLEVPDSHFGTIYNTAVQGQTLSASFKQEQFGIVGIDTDFKDVRTSEGVVPNSNYNQEAVLAQLETMPEAKTSLLWSRNEDLPRTDKWNGGVRITGPRSGSFRNYELQEFVFVNHEQELGDLRVNIAYQDFKEYIRNNSRTGPLTKMEQQSYTFNAEYYFNETIRFYTANTFEDLQFQQSQDSPWSEDDYDTTSYGISFFDYVGAFNYWASFGYKNVDISGVDSFETPEYSMLIGYQGWFASYDFTTRPPSYSDVLQNKATGRGVVIPNPNLEQEKASTFRIGYNKQGVYFDVYYKNVEDNFSQITLEPDVFQLVNAGGTEVIGSTFGYFNNKLFNTNIVLDSRIEYVWSEQENANGVLEPMQKTPDFWTYVRLEYDNWFTVLRYQPRDKNQPFKDLDDVRIFEHNNGLRTIDIGYTNRFKQVEYSIRANNILDDDGRVYGSSVDVPGRSLLIDIKYTF